MTEGGLGGTINLKPRPAVAAAGLSLGGNYRQSKRMDRQFDAGRNGSCVVQSNDRLASRPVHRRQRKKPTPKSSDENVPGGGITIAATGLCGSLTPPAFPLPNGQLTSSLTGIFTDIIDYRQDRAARSASQPWDGEHQESSIVTRAKDERTTATDKLVQRQGAARTPAARYPLPGIDPTGPTRSTATAFVKMARSTRTARRPPLSSGNISKAIISNVRNSITRPLRGMFDAAYAKPPRAQARKRTSTRSIHHSAGVRPRRSPAATTVHRCGRGNPPIGLTL